MSTLSYTTLREQVVSAIRIKILNQELAPGVRIIEQNLAQEFGVSRGPVREALRQLEQEGLVEYARNAGCSVRNITVDDIYEIYLMRSGYEMLAVGQFDGKFSPEDFQEMKTILSEMKALSEGDISTLIELDHRFHRIIIRKTGLSRLMKSWEELNYGSLIAGINGGSYKATLAQRQYEIHRSLLNELRSGDQRQICRAIYRHYMIPVKKIIAESGRSTDDFFFAEQV